ncbi:MAG: PIN domain-containing protein [Bacteroidales bacterium]|nr:MAG: PIN domain-containing protein [Bacteroidales bacterium]
MIIIDTSIWIEFLKQNPDYIAEMESLLENRKVIAIEPIFSELLYGSRSEKEKKSILAYWKILPKVKFSEGSFTDAADFANRYNFHNKGIGLIESIIYKASVENNYQVWTLDSKINNNLGNQLLYKSTMKDS